MCINSEFQKQSNFQQSCACKSNILMFQKKFSKTQAQPALMLSWGRIVLSIRGALFLLDTSHSKYTGNNLVLSLYLILLGREENFFVF